MCTCVLWRNVWDALYKMYGIPTQYNMLGRNENGASGWLTESESAMNSRCIWEKRNFCLSLEEREREMEYIHFNNMRHETMTSCAASLLKSKSTCRHEKWHNQIETITRARDANEKKMLFRVFDILHWQVGDAHRSAAPVRPRRPQLPKHTLDLPDARAATNVLSVRKNKKLFSSSLAHLQLKREIKSDYAQNSKAVLIFYLKVCRWKCECMRERAVSALMTHTHMVIDRPTDRLCTRQLQKPKSSFNKARSPLYKRNNCWELSFLTVTI